MSLVELLRNRDEQAFCNIFEKYKRLLYTVAFSILKDHDLTIDVVYEVFNRLYAKADELIDGKNIKYFLLTMTRNLALTYLKARKRTVPLDETVYDKFVLKPNYKFRPYEEVIAKFLTVLDEREIDILTLHIIEGLNYREIAGVLGLSYNQVTGIAHRAVKKIKKHYTLDDFYQ